MCIMSKPKRKYLTYRKYYVSSISLWRGQNPHGIKKSSDNHSFPFSIYFSFFMHIIGYQAGYNYDLISFVLEEL